MKIEKTRVYGFEPALRGMRNPMDSWHKSDTVFHYGLPSLCVESPQIGPNDLKLMKKLTKSGPEHRKFLRQIQIWVDFTLPRFVWQELDTYKISTTRNSCSTMHKLGGKTLTQEDFEYPIPQLILDNLNQLSMAYENTKDYQYVRTMKNILPEGFLQKATYSMNYETALNMYFQRKGHRLPQWNIQKISGIYSICKWISDLPYMDVLIEVREGHN